MKFRTIRIRNLGPFRDAALDLDAVAGPLVAITGANGAGKSTLLELLAGSLYRETPTRGSLVDLATARDGLVEVGVEHGARWTLRHAVDAVSGKGESFVEDESGAAVLADAKVRSFDAFAERALPPASVLYASTFAPQGSGGFLELKPADRKAVLLRVLGIEHLEQLAAVARERQRAASQGATILRARLEDEKRRGWNEGGTEGDVAAANANAERAADVVAAARRALADAETQAGDAAAVLRAHEEAAARAAGLRREAAEAERKRADLATRRANNAGLVARADEIRAAVVRAGELRTEIDDATARFETAKREFTAAEDEVVRASEDAQKVAAQHRAAIARAESRRAVVADAQTIRDAVAVLPKFEQQVATDAAALEQAEAGLRAVQGEALAGADERIDALREGLTSVVAAAREEDVRVSRAEVADIASDALLHDDQAVVRTAEHPARLAAAAKALDEARAGKRAADADLAAARRLADRLPELERAEAEVAEETADAERLAGELATAKLRVGQLIAGREPRQEAIGVAEKARDVLLAEWNALAPTVALAPKLDAAEARLAELDPQIADLDAQIARLTAEADAVDPGDRPPAPPDLDAARRAVAEADAAAKRAQEAAGAAQAALDAARASAGRAEQLAVELAAADADVADWTLLADSLGRDGLQAMEIDAAGPELTALVNDLLHTCVSTRWTVSIETQRLSADGKRTIEGCEVRVLDTERGRDASAETLSGGERVLVGEAVSLALSMLACRRTGAEGATLVRDETGAALDAANARAYVAMLRRAAGLVGASKVLFVSHSADVQELADARVCVAGGKIEVRP